MKPSLYKMATAVVLASSVIALTGCGLPRTGPTRSEIFAGSIQREGDAYIVPVDRQVTDIVKTQPSLGFSQAFRDTRVLGSDVINPGDTLGLTIWENVDEALLSNAANNFTNLEQVQVDGAGYIFVPYAGRIKASGNTPEQVRKIITDKLQDQTPDPQVQVRRLEGDGSTVSMLGSVSAQGVYPIQRPTRTLSAMIARAGGIAILPEVAQITVHRGNRREQVWFQDLYQHPSMDIALRNGDRILVEADTRSFTILGATQGQARVKFPTQTISAVEALALVGGLSSVAADPKGVFVFRDEPQDIARRVTGDQNIIGEQRVVYVLDLTQPNGLFTARDFVVRDQDTLYVTEAPFTQWNKTIGAITGTLGSAQALANSTQAISGN